jgi:hypothetical protein
MAEVRDVLWTIQQSMVEMGLPKPAEVVLSQDATVQQMLALLNRAGADMVIGFPWEQLTKEYVFNSSDATVAPDGLTMIQPLPSDWSYFTDQTQWDRTNHWPLLGPKTAQEWQWLKGGLLSSGPRIRYRVVSGNLELFPGSSIGSTIAMEYVADTWLKSADQANTYYASVQSDKDILLLDPWIMTAYLKLKYWEAKGLNTAAYTKDFLGTWEARIGKNKGAPMLTLAPRARTMLIGINNIPDGSWNVGNGNTA